MVWRTQASPIENNQKVPSLNRNERMLRDRGCLLDVSERALAAFGGGGRLQ
jgi:hypothetical protein